MKNQFASSLSSLAVIGSGNMASAILTGLQAKAYPMHHVWVSDRSQAKTIELQQQLSVQVANDNLAAASHADCILLAVKPYHLAEVLDECHHLLVNGHKTLISIAAGVPIKRLLDQLGSTVPVVRAMPNTPALVQQALTGLYAHPEVTLARKHAVEYLFSAVGEIVWLEQEQDIDIITAISGSGPGYFFQLLDSFSNGLSREQALEEFEQALDDHYPVPPLAQWIDWQMEVMIKAAQDFGFSQDLAIRVVRKTARGSLALAKSQPDSFATLRDKVTSKGGTTEAALKHFQEYRFPKQLPVGKALEKHQESFKQMVHDAIKAAHARAVELSQ